MRLPIISDIPIIPDIAKVIADAIDLAAEIMCPRDHSCEYRARKAREAQAAADALADAEAEVDHWEPVCVTCGKQDCAYPEAYLSRAEGTQRADSSGEVGDATPDPSPSPERPVSHEDLAAHIYAIANMCIIRRNDRVPRMADVCDEIARDLLSDYRITKK
jgi:hypothetical protein